MILSAMMFALGVLVSGLPWLVFSVALVRRTRRLTERRLLASISVSRTEFVTERDELRARHAVEMHRLEREVSRVLDMATAYRLEADVKEIDLASLRAEFAAREDNLLELQARFEVEHRLTRELERRNAESGAALRSAQHALALQSGRRAAEEEPSAAPVQLRPTPAVQPGEAQAPQGGVAAASEAGAGKLPRIVMLPPEPAAAQAAARPAEPEKWDASNGASVVSLPTRTKPSQGDSPDQSVALVAEAARDLQRLAGEGHGDMAKGVWRAPAHADARMPVATGPGESTVADLMAHRMVVQLAESDGGKIAAAPNENAESRFLEALAEIRALKRATSQAGE